MVAGKFNTGNLSICDAADVGTRTWFGPENIRHAFEAIDTDASGHLSVTEFKEALNRLGMGLTNHQLNSISRDIRYK